MPNLLSATGLQTMTRDELVTYFKDKMKLIYGADINLESDTPDGQAMNIFIQSMLDMQDLVTQIYNSFDPDFAFGVSLDQRVAINGIQRQAGTRTITNVTITTTKALTLYGADQVVEPPYTVADDAGNKWELVSSVVIGGAGDNILAFRSATAGKVLTIPNTITTPVTIVLGVSAINNPTTYTTLGIDEESDASLKIRRQKAVSQASQGYLASLYSAIANVSGVTTIKIYENNTAATDADGIPAHSIWVIVGGNGDTGAIANAIYQKRNAGCGMKGTQTYVITQVDGSNFIIRWDVIQTVNLFIKFTASSLDGVTAPDIAAIKDGLIANFVPALYEKVNINDLATQVQVADNNTLVTNSGFCETVGGAYTTTALPDAKNKQYVLSPANIIILPIIIKSTNSVITITGGFAVTTLAIAAGGATETFSALGGHGTITWSKDSGAGSINAATGVYTSAGAGTDVIRATDDQGNFTTVTITVT